MTNSIIIFCAKYLCLLPPFAAVFFFAAQPRERRREMLVFGGALVALSLAAYFIAGFCWYNPRPFAAGGFTPLVAHKANNGFPSGHTLVCAAIAAIVFRFGKKTGLVLWALTVVVGAARVLAGVHHAADIIDSIALVLLCLFPAGFAAGKFAGRKA
jgi:undecaprenyl-diphosphatase